MLNQKIVFTGIPKRRKWFFPFSFQIRNFAGSDVARQLEKGEGKEFPGKLDNLLPGFEEGGGTMETGAWLCS